MGVRLREVRSRSGGLWGRLSEDDTLAVSLSGLRVYWVRESLLGERVSSVILDGYSLVGREMAIGLGSGYGIRSPHD